MATPGDEAEVHAPLNHNQQYAPSPGASNELHSEMRRQ